jgi:2-polyprenyl-6-hydroxyphenyl methylase/3-demethylubiquinone-9 3-methyltransferase
MSFFANFADSWEDPEGAMALLHRMQQARSLFMRSYLPATAKLGLDIGCGGGINTLDLARCGYEMTGIDSESSLIAVAQKQSDKQHLLVQWHHSCITEFHPPELYDFICCYEVLEHVRDPSEA